MVTALWSVLHAVPVDEAPVPVPELEPPVPELAAASRMAPLATSALLAELAWQSIASFCWAAVRVAWSVPKVELSLASVDWSVASWACASVTAWAP